MAFLLVKVLLSLGVGLRDGGSLPGGVGGLVLVGFTAFNLCFLKN